MSEGVPNKHSKWLQFDDKPKTPVILNKYALMGSISIAILLIILNIKYPGPQTVFQQLFTWIGLPTHSGENGYGLHYVGILTLAIFTVFVIMVNRALNRYKIWVVALVIILVVNGPILLTTTYQRTIARAVYAVEVDPNKVDCNYVLVDNNFTGTCNLSIINYSKDTVEVYPTLHFANKTTPDELTLPDIKLNAIILPPLTQQEYKSEFNYTVSNYSDIKGSAKGGFIIQLSDGTDERTFK